MFNNELDHWLDGSMQSMNMTRREFIRRENIDMKDIEWAFYAGIIYGTSGPLAVDENGV